MSASFKIHQTITMSRVSQKILVSTNFHFFNRRKRKKERR